jgi:hypothetical protein
MPSALCYKQISDDQWTEHFCLVNPTCQTPTESEASSAAASDLDAAFEVRQRGGSDGDFALFLQSKGYVTVDGYRRAIDPEVPKPAHD